MRISIFGLGYVGCVSAACLAKNRHDIIGIDIDKNKVGLLNKGIPTIFENGLDTIISSVFKEKKLKATTDYLDAVKTSSISIICVGTPNLKNGHLNHEHIFKVVRQIGEALKQKDEFHIITIRSTVFPGTNQKCGEIIEEISRKQRGVHFDIVSNPEFMREGSAIHDYYNPSYTVIGTDDDRSFSVIKSLFENVSGEKYKVSIKVAEMIKLISNSYHALKICFANEIGNICKKFGIDSHEMMELFCLDKNLNISPSYFKPGFAYGGSCLPKDLRALNTLAHDFYIDTPVLNSIENSNNRQIENAFDIIASIRPKKIAMIGLSFKRGTDDLRNSPYVTLTEKLIGQGYPIIIFDDCVYNSDLIGSNKAYIDNRIPHLRELIYEDLFTVINSADTIVIGRDEEGLVDILNKVDGKNIIDLCKINNLKNNKSTYYGLSW